MMPSHSPCPYFAYYNLSQKIHLSVIYQMTHFKVRSWLSDEVSIYPY